MEKNLGGENDSPKVVWPRSAGPYYSFYETLVTLTLEAEDDAVAIAALKLQGACSRAYGRPAMATFNGISVRGVPIK